MRRLRELGVLVRTRIVLMMREPEIVFWVFCFPLVMSMALGLAFRERGAEKSRVWVLDGESADEIARALGADELIELRRGADRTEAEHALRSGAVDALVHSDGELRIVREPARPEGELARLRVERALGTARGDPVSLAKLESPTERGTRYVDWLVPGLLGLNLMGGGVWGVGYAIVDTRVRKLLRRLLVSPMSRVSYLASFLIARQLMVIAEVAILIVFARFVLDVPFRAEPVSFLAVCLLGGIAFAALGLLLGSRVRTTEAASGMMNLGTLPMMIASGVFFSAERFSQGLQPIVRALPLTALNDALRAMMLDGKSVFQCLGPLAIVIGWGIGCSVLGLALMRWE
jgi:ABC-type multidrug transport system permease subunit